MSTEQFTQLPQVSTAQFTDIICAVQGYVNPANPGLSVQENLQQVYNLFQSNVILYYLGNPNGNLAGQTYQLCWDTVDNILWVCTTTGSTTTAVWTKSITLTAGTGIAISQNANNIVISGTGGGVGWNQVVTSTQILSSNSGYSIQYSGGLCNLTLPVSSDFGDIIYIAGYSIGGFRLTYGASQQIIIGNTLSTVTTGNIASTNQYDALQLLCVVPNLIWQATVGVQGNITIA